MQPHKKLLPLAIAAAAAGTLPPAVAEDAQLLEEVVVTGSRIGRTTFDTPSPTTVIDAEAIRMSGELNLNEMLSTMPQFGAGFDSTTGSYSFGNSGLNALDLRDLGVKRTLVLVNGQRPVQIAADDNTLIAEIGMIPSELVERVEVLTGGASAVYGADAVAGVVNFILRKDYEGSSLRTQFGDSQQGGAANQSLTYTFGQNFADNRGNFAASVDYFKQKPLYYRDRKGAAGTTRYMPNPDNTGPDDGIPDFIIHNNISYPDFNVSGNTFGVWNEEAGGLDWYQLEGGEARLRTPTSAIVDGWMVTDGSGFSPNAYNFARSPFERYNAYSRAHYELSDDLTLSADLMFSRTKSYDQIDPDFIWATWASVDGLQASGIPVPGSVLQVLDDHSETWLKIPYTFDEAGPRWHRNQRDYLAGTVTLEGGLDNGWKWDTHLASGYTKARLTIGNNMRLDRIDPASFTLIGPCVEAGNCPQFSPFETASQEVLDYIMVQHDTHTDVKQHTFSANLSGGLFELPAGEVKLGAGVEARYESLDYRPSELWSSGLLSSMKTPIDDKSRNVREVYGELLLPLLADLPLVKSLELETALRTAAYSTQSADFTSWKTGLNWAINDSLRFRSVYSKAVRAPQLGEMYLGTSIGYSGLTDPCDTNEIDGGPSDGRRKANCAALGIDEGWDSNLKSQRGKVISEGNDTLKEEEATTFTAGLVFIPSFIEGLNLSLDYYDIDLEDMIVRFGASTTLALCVDMETIDNEFCKQIVREANGDVESVRDTYINADGSRRRGVDLETDYRFGLDELISGAGDLRFNLVATRQLESSYTATNLLTGRDETTDHVGTLGAPKWKAGFTTTYYHGDLTLSLASKYTQGGPFNRNATPERYQDHRVRDSLYHNLWAGYQFNEMTQLYLGVNNLTNESWTNHPYTSYGSNTYSLLGRYYYAGLNLSF